MEHKLGTLCVLVAVLTSALVPPAEACEPSELGYACKQQLAEYIAVHWSVGGASRETPLLLAGEVPPPEEGEIAFALTGQTEGWVGFGFTGTSGLMFPSAVYYGWIKEDGETSATAYAVENNSINASNVDEDVELKNVVLTEVDETTTFAFTKAIDGQGLNQIRLEGEMDVIYAVGPADGLNYHRLKRGGGTMELGAAL